MSIIKNCITARSERYRKVREKTVLLCPSVAQRRPGSICVPPVSSFIIHGESFNRSSQYYLRLEYPYMSLLHSVVPLAILHLIAV